MFITQIDLSVPINTKDVGLIPADNKVYLIQHHYVIKFVSGMWQVGGFLQVIQFPSSIKH